MSTISRSFLQLTEEKKTIEKAKSVERKTMKKKYLFVFFCFERIEFYFQICFTRAHSMMKMKLKKEKIRFVSNLNESPSSKFYNT